MTDWIHLTSGKEFSRLLYTNPVCLLSTVADISNEPSGDQVTIKKCNRDGAASEKNEPSTHINLQRNVMVLSWLTATNNSGRFLFSINKSRYSTELLAPQRSGDIDSCAHKTGVEFSLSVPVKGMEELVKDVGSISGRCCCKFQSNSTSPNGEESRIRTDRPEGICDNLSNRQRKKLRLDTIKNNGILGLIPVPLGYAGTLERSGLLAIKGTVAHLRCRTYAVIGPHPSDSLGEMSNNANSTKRPSIDDDHLLIMAEVTDAYVHPSYWDPTKLLFCPRQIKGEEKVSPYLTFFGSQTFGYVVSSIADS